MDLHLKVPHRSAHHVRSPNHSSTSLLVKLVVVQCHSLMSLSLAMLLASQVTYENLN
uniref:Uncharacterized protein n=1 Tax=Kalanchoe fedtschenkoi TaxID=63787 RepID=A0A7N0U8H4_KALFE